MLGMLDALDADRALTEVGRTMVTFPILPRHARILVEAMYRYPEVLEEAIIAAAFLSVPAPFIMPEATNWRRAAPTTRFATARRPGCVPGPVRPVSRQQRPRRILRAPLSGAAHHVRDLNVKEQLEAIVSGLGVPVSGGGPTTHYLCAVGRGLIQFICVAAGPGRYRSPTAGNIFIHPGSGMYQQPARYIMAGEIMRTARAYARSVSPLTREQVRAISPDLLADLIAVSGDGSKGERRAGRGRPPGARRRCRPLRPAPALGFDPRRRGADASARAGVRRNGTAQQAAAGNPAMAGRRSDRAPRRAPLAGRVSLVARSHHP